MSVSDAETAPFKGARWVRAALQVNPYGYVGNPSPSRDFPDEESYNAALLDACDDAGIELLAVTDHWNVASAKGLIVAAAERGITALPGFEANSSEGTHLLVIFEKGTKLSDITLAIGLCDVDPSDPHSLAKKTYAEIVAAMTERHAVVIPPHANVKNSGLLWRGARPLEAMIKNESVLAIGITPGVASTPDQSKILNNKAPYTRRYPLVEIFADDVSNPKTLATAGATTWFKMCEPSLAGLNHAVRTPRTRVRREDPASTSRVLLRELSWVGGFLNGQSLQFSDDLTALIGGRGTGKSTAIESLRYVLELDPIGEDARRDHELMIKNVVRTATTISLTVDVASPTPARYVIERTVPNPAIVRDASGTVTSQRPKDIVGSLEIFGQHELAEVAQDKTRVAAMVTRITGKSAADAGRPELLQRLKDNREVLDKTERAQERLEGELAELPRLTEQADKYSKSDVGVKLQLRTQLKAEDGVFTETRARLAQIQQRLAHADLTGLSEALRAPLSMIDESPRRELLEPAKSALESAAVALDAALSAVEVARADAEKKTDDAKQAWAVAVQPDVDANEEVFRQLIADGANPDAYDSTVTQLARLNGKASQRVVLQKRRDTALKDRRQLLDELATNDMEIAKELNAAITAATDNAALSSTVVVKPTPNPDRAALKAVVASGVKSARTQITAAIDRDDFSTKAFVEAIRAGEEALKKYGVVGAQARNLLALGESFNRELEELSVGVAVDVLLNVAPKGQGSDLHKLEDLSKGQRATALLLLLLGGSTSPLVIDQPEDDLDNRFVYDGVVERLKDLKGQRQVIVSTHNANVPVLGDAEMVYTLEGTGQHGWVADGGAGSLDTPSVREYAEDILEGGKDAFNARKHLYGF